MPFLVWVSWWAGFQTIVVESDHQRPCSQRGDEIGTRSTQLTIIVGLSTLPPMQFIASFLSFLYPKLAQSIVDTLFLGGHAPPNRLVHEWGHDSHNLLGAPQAIGNSNCRGQTGVKSRNPAFPCHDDGDTLDSTETQRIVVGKFSIPLMIFPEAWIVPIRRRRRSRPF